jgi:hypothetical protein
MLWLVLAVQFAFLFVLGERTPPAPRKPSAAQTLQLTSGRTEELRLLDPTLIARPQRASFGVSAWLNRRAPELPSFVWYEPERPLLLVADTLGLKIQEIIPESSPSPLTLGTRPFPEMVSFASEQPTEVLPASSTLTLHGPLSKRTLIQTPELPAFESAEPLTSTVIQVWVNGDGYVHSAVQLGAERVGGGSGSQQADVHAMNTARSLRFEPVTNTDWLDSSAISLTRGTLIFQWRTVPVREANGSAKTP